MAIVIFSSELQKLTGEAQTSTQAAIFKDIVQELALKFPRLEAEKLFEMAVAIDGVIIHTPFLEVIEPTGELHFLHRISGG